MRIAGVDEAGRGPLAGPVVAAAVVFKQGYSNPKIRDSKQLSAKMRESLVEQIHADALSWAVVSVGHVRIEKYNILRASLSAMSLALRRIQADMVLVDGNQAIDTTIPQQTVIGGDGIHVQIAAASILAKVFRDKLMCQLDTKYPGYGFSRHAGYGTKEHREAIKRQGPCRIHRRTFSGVREFWSDNSQSHYGVIDAGQALGVSSI